MSRHSPVRYQILHEEDPETLQQRANTLVARGWEPLGGVVVTTWRDPLNTLRWSFTQAFWRRSEPPTPAP